MNIDEYIAQFEGDVHKRLVTLRTLILSIEPQFVERMAYGMPTFALKKNVCHIAAFTNHIGFYPGSAVIESFLPQLKDYKTSKGTVQFPHNMPLPLPLIEAMVKEAIAKHA